jgi:hypothetical protein
MKRILIIIATIIVLLGIVVGLYIFLQPAAHLTVSNGNGAFGDTGSGNAPTQSTAVVNTTAGSAGTVVAPSLIKITDGPVSAGEAVFDIPPAQTSSTTFTPGDVGVRYIDRESGNVYQYNALTRKLTRLSDKTLPGIQEASWLPDGSAAFVQFLAQTSGVSHIDTYELPFDGNGGYFLQQDLAQAAVIGSSSVFTLTTNSSGSVGSLARADGSSIKTLFTSPLTSIVARAAGANIVTVTKASSELDGYAFTLSGGAFTPILGPLRGLTILPSPSGNIILYSYTDGSALHMAALNLSSGTNTILPLATLAEKCVWTADNTTLYCAIPTSVSGNLPDDWYQGAVSFTDRIWRIDLTSRLATLVLDPSSSGKTDIDAVNLTIDPNSQVLIFRNKKDSSLWAFSL